MRSSPQYLALALLIAAPAALAQPRRPTRPRLAQNAAPARPAAGSAAAPTTTHPTPPRAGAAATTTARPAATVAPHPTAAPRASATGGAPRPANATATGPSPAPATPAPATPAPATPTPAGTAPPPPAAGATLTAQQVAEQVQAFYDRTDDFEADFVQVTHNRLYGRTERRTGHVHFLKPGRMRWDYAAPVGDVVVSDGTTLWAYEAAQTQAVQSNLSQSQLPSALSFLTGTGRLTNDFTFTLLDAAQFQYPSGYVLQLRPVTPNPSYDRLIFFVAPGSFQVASTVVLDAQANQNRFTFTNVRVNTHPPQSLFQWTPPHGTQIVRP